MYVAIVYWLSRNNFRSKNTKLGQLTGGVFQSLKVDDRLAVGYGFLNLRYYNSWMVTTNFLTKNKKYLIRIWILHFHLGENMVKIGFLAKIHLIQSLQ